MTPERYEVMTAPLRRHPGAVKAMIGINRGLSALCYAIYPALLLFLLATGDGRLWRCLLVPAISFAAVSVFRKLYHAPRPYEMGIDSLMKKKRQGCSFPSRHVFSAFVIAGTWYSVWPVLGGILMLVGVALAVIRVVGGVHYPKDVLAGAVIGLLSAWIGFSLIP